MRRAGGQIDQDEPFTDGPNHGGWLQHMVAGHSRVKAGAELAASVKTDNFPLDIEEVSRLLKEAPAPPSREYILDLLRPEEAMFLALSVHWGAGKARKLKRSITLGNMELDLSTLSKRQICSRLNLERGQLTGVIALACYIAIMRPSAADLAKLEENDQRNFQSLMAGQRRPVQGAATLPFPPQPGSGAAFLNPVTPQPVQTSEAEFEAYGRDGDTSVDVTNNEIFLLAYLGLCSGLSLQRKRAHK
eukprot:6455882-Amphidinium_carterae.1